MRFQLSCLVLVSITWSGCLTDGADVAQIERFEWQPGLAFAYVRGGEHLVTTSENGSTTRTRGTLANDFVAFRVAPVNSWSASNAYVVESQTRRVSDPQTRSNWLDSTSTVQTPDQRALVALRTSDFMGVPIDYRFKERCESLACTPVLADLSVAAGPPEKYVDFPLFPGKTWQFQLESDNAMVEAELANATIGLIEWSVTGKVLDARSTGKIWKRPGPVIGIDYVYEMTPQAAHSKFDSSPARESYDVRARIHDTMVYDTLEGVMVWRETQLEIHGVEAFRGAQSRWERTTTSTGKAWLVLAGLQHDVRAEDSPALFLGRRNSILNDLGLTADPLLEIESNNDAPNAAEKPIVKFSAPKPEGADRVLTWSLRTLEGHSVANGTGNTFSHKFESPGAYTVVAALVNKTGAPIARVQRPFAVDYVTTANDGCPLLVLGNASPCPSRTLPVFPGIDRIEVRATLLGDVSERGEAQLEVDHADGVYYLPFKGDEVNFLLDSFAHGIVNDKPWQVRALPQLAAATTVAYEIHLLYHRAWLA